MQIVIKQHCNYGDADGDRASSVGELGIVEVVKVLQECVTDDLTIQVMDLLASRRRSWAVDTDRKYKRLLNRRNAAARHYIQVALFEIANRLMCSESKLVTDLSYLVRMEKSEPARARLQRYIFLATQAVIRSESSLIRNFIRECVLIHEGPIQGSIRNLLRKKNMLGGDESLDDRILRLTETTFRILSDCCMEPRLAHIFWARKCKFDADSGLAYSYIEQIAKNTIYSATRNDLGPQSPPSRKRQMSKEKTPPKKESQPYKVLYHLGEFFQRSTDLRDSMPTQSSKLTLSDEDYDAEPLCSRFSERIFDLHFRSRTNGAPDRVWQVFWARVIKGMPREEAAHVFSRDVGWIRKRESELRKTIILIVDETKDE